MLDEDWRLYLITSISETVGGKSVQNRGMGYRMGQTHVYEAVYYGRLVFRRDVQISWRPDREHGSYIREKEWRQTR